MPTRSNIEKYRNCIKKNTGKSVSLYLKKGRGMLYVKDCVIENAYESIFVVKITGESLVKISRISICYADLLTGCAKLVLNTKEKPA